MKKLIVLLSMVFICTIAYCQTDTLRGFEVYNGVKYRIVYVIKHTDMVKAKSAPGFAYTAPWGVPTVANIYKIGSDNKFYLVKKGVPLRWQSATAMRGKPSQEFINAIK